MKIAPGYFFFCVFWLLIIRCMPASMAQATRIPAAASKNVQLIREKGRIRVMAEGRLLTQYVFGNTELQGCKKPVLFPILTPEGTTVTRGYPLAPRPSERTDHPHHVGLWFNYGDANGHDFWNNSTAIGPEHKGPFGMIVHTGIQKMKGGRQGAVLTVTAEWRAHDSRPMLHETTTFVFSVLGGTLLIDRTTTLKALDTAVVFKDNKEGLIALRVARFLEHPSQKPELFTDANGRATTVPAIDTAGVTGRYRSSEGAEGEAVWGTRARWMNLTGRTGNRDVSVAILDHPANPGYPAYWHARGYGLFAANPLGPSVFSGGKAAPLHLMLPAGEKLTFRYRIAVADKPLADAALNQLAAAFAPASR